MAGFLKKVGHILPGGILWRKRQEHKKKKAQEHKKKTERRHEHESKQRERARQGKDTGSIKIGSGKKYTRLQRFQTLSPDQKKLQKQWLKTQKPEKFKKTPELKEARKLFKGIMKKGPKQPKLEKKGEEFLQKGMKKGPPVSKLEKEGAKFLKRGMQQGPAYSPMESYGGMALQRILGRSPEEQVQGFEAPYLREFEERGLPSLAERFTALGGQKGSGFLQAATSARAGLSENLAAMKQDLINQLYGQQTQAANVGLGYAQLPGQRYALQQQDVNMGLSYAQLPGQRYGQQQQDVNAALAYSQLPGQRLQQQMQAAQAGTQMSLLPQEAQRALNQYAENAQFQREQQVAATQPWGFMGVPPRGRQPSFWQGLAPRLGGAIQGAAIGGAAGGPWGAAAGAVGGALGASPPPISVGSQAPVPISAGTQRIMSAPTGPLAGSNV